MALIKCEECGKEISDKAKNCPGCGNPNQEHISTIELTSKKWKKITLISLFMMMFSFLFGGVLGPIAIFTFILGFFGILIAKLGSWWTNK